MLKVFTLRTCMKRAKLTKASTPRVYAVYYKVSPKLSADTTKQQIEAETSLSLLSDHVTPTKVSQHNTLHHSLHLAPNTQPMTARLTWHANEMQKRKGGGKAGERSEIDLQFVFLFFF